MKLSVFISFFHIIKKRSSCAIMIGSADLGYDSFHVFLRIAVFYFLPCVPFVCRCHPI